MPKLLAVLGGFLCLAPAAHAALVISSGATQNVTCTPGKCSSTAADAVLNADALAAMLAQGSVAVKAQAGAQTIAVTAPLSWASQSALVLKAELDVDIKAAVAVQGTGGINVATGALGDLKFSGGGRIDFWDTAGRFVLNGKRHVLVNDIAAMKAAYSRNQGAVLALAKDYDAGPDGVYASPPIASMNGTFEGLGHGIANFSASGGLIAHSQDGVMRDVTLADATIVNGGNIGTLAGDAGNSQVIGVHSSGTVTGHGKHEQMGGLAGTGGIFIRSDSSASVTCTRNQCRAGGLVGYGGSFLLCHASGTVTADAKTAAGGLTGDLFGMIVQSYATGDIVMSRDSKADLGGLAGSVFDDSLIADSYARGAVRTHGGIGIGVGGVIGFGRGNTVTNAYATGTVQDGGTPPLDHVAIGGFVGVTDSVHGGYSNAYWDIDTSGTTAACGKPRSNSTCPAITGLSDAALKAGLPAGFDPAIWTQDPAINDGYPYLRNNPPE